jgi:hypothetical protein
MNVLILGCSFGVPNYFGLPSPPPQDHTEFILRDLGHTVINCAKNGGSNLDSLKRAQNFLSGKPIAHPAYRNRAVQGIANQSIDWIVWFHTELYRDFLILPNKTNLYEHDSVALAEMTYQAYRDFQLDTGAKLAVIGGAGDLHQCFDKYFTPEFVIRSWRSEILGIDNTPNNTLWQQEYFNHSRDPIEQKLMHLESNLDLLDLMHASVDFPDNCHPGPRPHRELSEKLHITFQV